MKKLLRSARRYVGIPLIVISCLIPVFFVAVFFSGREALALLDRMGEGW